MKILLITLLLVPPALAAQDRPLKILERPTPSMTKEQKEYLGATHIQGRVILKVEFLASGSIGDIVPIIKLPYFLTDNAIEVARKIRFLPKLVAGQRVTTKVTVSYAFSESDGGWQKIRPSPDKQN